MRDDRISRVCSEPDLTTAHEHHLRNFANSYCVSCPSAPIQIQGTTDTQYSSDQINWGVQPSPRWNWNFRRRVYSRVGPLFVSRNARCSNLGMFIVICILFSTCCFIITFLTRKVDYNSPNIYARLAELPTWGLNRSVNLQTYIDPSDANSFIWQPTALTSSVNSTPLFCGSDEVKLVILIASAPSHFLQRQAIRDTWGSHQELSLKSATLFFLIGRSVNETSEEEVTNEVANYGDLIQDDFLDTYHNLTLKSISMLKWINLTCSTNFTSSLPHYVLKADDDVFINVGRLFNVIRDTPGAKMIGRLICGAEPITDTKSKLFMPHYLYPGKTYPGYLSGTAYVLTGDIVPKLLEAAFKTPLIHMEDIYITGILARKSEIFPEDSAYFTYLTVDSKEICVVKEMVSSHNIQPSEMRKIWNLLKNDTSHNCSSVLTPTMRRKLIRKPVPRVKNMSKRLKKLCMFPV